MVSLLTLTACDWGKGGGKVAEQAAGGDVLLTIGDKPAVTVTDFETYYNQILDQQPQLRSFAAFMPDLKLNVFSTLASQKIIEHWAQENKIEQKPEYQTDRRMLAENMDRGLAIKYFQTAHPVAVNEQDVKNYYEENKDTLYAMSPAGVNAVAVSFDQEAPAKTFLEKVKHPGADFTKAATESKLTVRNLGKVNEQSQGVDKELKEKIVALKKVPSVQLLNAGKTYWVVQAKSKDTAKYYPFEQAKEDAQTRVNTERMGEMFNTEIEKLKKEYNVVEFKKYFEHQKAEGEKAAQAGQAPTADAEQNQVATAPAVAQEVVQPAPQAV